MVVAPNDLAPLAGGFADDASFAIPAGEDGLIPDDVDTAALSDLEDADAAASVVGEGEAESDPDPDAELRSQIETQLRDQITADVQAQFDQRFREFQSQKDREVAQARHAADGTRAFNQALVESYVQRLTEAGMEQADIERELDAIQGKTSRRVQQAAQASQQSDGQFTSWAESQAQAMASFLQETARGENGEVLFDPQADRELQQYAVAMFTNAREFLRTNDEKYLQAQRQAHTAHQRRAYQLREAGIRRVLTEQRKKNAEPQRKAREVQAQRGRQAVATGGGAGPLSADALMAQAEAIGKERGLDPNRNYDDIFGIYMSLKHTQQ